MKIKFDQDRTETFVELTFDDIIDMQYGDALVGAGVTVRLDAEAMHQLNGQDAAVDDMMGQLHECEATVAMIGVGDDAPAISLADVLDPGS